MSTAETQPQEEINLVDLTRGLLTVMQMDESRGEQANDLLDHLASGGTLADLHGFEESDLEAMYSMARTFYNNQKYEDAETLFKFLCFMDNTGKKWWMGLGATYQMTKRFEEAIRAYGYCTLLDIEDPRPQLQAGYCLMQLGRNEEAVAALEGAQLAPNATAATKLQAEALLSKIASSAE